MTSLLFPGLAPPRPASIGACARLLDEYADLIEVNPSLDRTLVSFQANREAPFYGWFKYKEGFSAPLVRYLLRHLASRPGVLLDPFAGAGAALFVGRDLGWHSVGIELLPVGWTVIESRLAAEQVDSGRFQDAVSRLRDVDFARYHADSHALRHVPITRGAFSEENERALVGYLAYCDRTVKDPVVRKLLRFAAFCVLETISYTRKDGQYLRWDYRSRRSRGSKDFDKGPIIPFDDAVRAKLDQMLNDLQVRPAHAASRGAIDVRRGSCLDLLPTIADGTVDFVVTSPPYCNRYDYTRTYALELVFLGMDQAQIAHLRQQMLSCTVENREKRMLLESSYRRRGHAEAFKELSHVVDSQQALREVLCILERYRRQEKLNNTNIVRMVRNYFYEMAFVIYELARVMRKGAKAVIINDNVRYAGEEVPVDLILSDFAEHFGLRTKHIWTLPRGKGNSSQQMGAHGRSELRKCVYVWERA